MRYVRIFLLNFENVFQYRSQIFVWFLISVFHPLIYLLFWRGSSNAFSDVILYYLFFLVAGGLLFVHVEVDAYEDIQQGQLSMYLMRPLSYLKIKFCSELPWRLIQGSFGLFSLLLISIFFSLPHLSLQGDQAYIALGMTILGYMIMFLFKMTILLLAFWFTDIGGLLQLSEIFVITFGGFIMPIRFFPDWIAHIIYLTPFPYAIYFPVSAFQGTVDVKQGLSIMAIQLTWIIVFFFFYQYLWKEGVKKYSGIGQ